MLIPMISSVLVFFLLGFNGEQPVSLNDRSAELTVRGAKSLLGVLMITGMTYGAHSLLDDETPTIETGEDSTEYHEFASNGTCITGAHQPLTMTILGNPATTLWYSTTRTPAPIINVDGTPLSHTASDGRKFEEADAFQNMIDFAIFSIIVGVFMCLCFRLLNKILQLFFEGNWSQVHTQDTMGFHTLNVNPTTPMPTDPSIKDSLDQILNAMRMTRTRSEVRLESGDLGDEHHDTLEMLRSEIASNSTTQPQVTARLLTRMNNMEEKISGRFQESDTEVQRSFGEIRRLVENLNRRYTNDQNKSNKISEEVKTTLRTLDNQIQALNGNVEQLKAGDQNSKIAIMDAKIERIIKVFDTKELMNKIQILNETVEQLCNDKIGALEGKIDKVNNSIQVIDSTKKIQAFGRIIEQLRDRTSKSLTVDSPHFQMLNERVMEIHSQVLGAPNAFIDLKYLTEGLNQKVENLEREMQKASNKLSNYEALESKIADVQRDLFHSMARRNDVLSVTKELQEEFQRTRDLSREVQEIHKDISKLPNLGGDVRCMTEQLKKMQEELHTTKNLPENIEALNKIQEVHDLVRRNHDSISSRLETNAQILEEHSIFQTALAKMQGEQSQKNNDTPKDLLNLEKKIQELEDDLKQKHDSLVSRLEANGCSCQNTLVTMPEETPKTNEVPGKIHDLSQEIEDVREVQAEHTSAISKLEAGLQNLDIRLNGQETRADTLEKAHEERLNIHEESLNGYERTLSTYENNLSGLRIELDRIKEENATGPVVSRQEISKSRTDPEDISALIQQLANEAIQLHVATHWDELKANLETDLDDKFKALDLHLWKNRFMYQVTKLEEIIEGSRCKCNDANLVGNAASLEETVKERIAESCAEWEKRIQDKLTTIRENLDSFEKERAMNDVRLNDVDERLQGIEYQAQKTNDLFFQRFSKTLRDRFGEDQQETLNRKLKQMAKLIEKEGIGYGIRQLLDRVDGIFRRLHSLVKTVHGDSSITPVRSVLEQLDTFQTELGSLSNVYNLPGVLKALEEYDQAGLQTSAFTQQDNQQTAVPIQLNAPIAPQSNPEPRLVSRRQLSESDEIPPAWREILAHGPPGEDSLITYASPSIQPSASTQIASVQPYSPVLQTSTIRDQVNIGQQASPQYQPHTRDEKVTQLDIPSPITLEEQSTEPQERLANISGRKIKVPLSRRKSHQKQQQQQQQPQPSTTDFTVLPQQRRPQQQSHDEQQQQQLQKPAQQEQKDKEDQQPLTLEDIIDEIQLANMTTTGPSAQETTAQPPSSPPSPPNLGPEAQALLEGEAAERARSHMVYDPLFDDFFDDDEINKVLDEEERKNEEEEKSKIHPLSLPASGNVQATDVPQSNQAETSQAATQESLQKEGEPATQERKTVREVQRDLPPPAETSKPVETSGKQEKEDEGYWQKTLPPLPPLKEPLKVSPSDPIHADEVTKIKTGNSATASRKPQKVPGAAEPTRPLSSPFLGRSVNRSQLTDRMRGLPSQAQSESNPQKVSGEQKVVSIAVEKPSKPQGTSDVPPKKGTGSDFVEDPREREIRHQAVIDAFATIKGKSMYDSRWADPPEAKEEPSKKETHETAKTKTSGEDKTPTEQTDKPTHPSLEVLDDRKIRHQAVIEAFSNYKGAPMSASRWADEPDEYKEAAPTPKSEAGASPVVRAPETAYSGVKGEENLAVDNLPGTPEKWNEWAASTGGAKSIPAETLAEREEKFQAVKEAWGTVKGTPLSASRWATKEDEKVDTPRSEAEKSPFRGSRGRHQKEDLMKFDRLKEGGKGVAAETSVASALAEDLGEKNNPISEEQNDQAAEEGDPFEGVEEELVFLDED